ncbi:NUDIX hydrolase [Aestuariimicrobium soli]|uniref:NUDIX hydrolase n=1 Tax=Aestuariimicrobium soli TaxID=2035834 RepID=UPI003EB88022
MPERALPERFSVVPAAYVFLLRESVDEAQVLLQLRRNTGYMDDHWAAAAAGHVERGETVTAAAHREALEELGITDLELTFVTTMQRTQREGAGAGLPINERVDFFFTARSWAGEPTITEPHKSAGLRWFGLHDLPAETVPHERIVLEGLRSGDLPPFLSVGFDRGI